MRILLVVGHPKSGSFNHAIAEAAKNAAFAAGHEVYYIDLYQEMFDPVIDHEEMPRGAPVDGDIKRHCEYLASADGIIVVHPNWWGQPPAIMKGWIDRVFRPGVAYQFREGDKGEGVPVGLLKARAAIVFNTSNTSDEREKAAFGDPLEALWKNCIFDLCGVKQVHRRMFPALVSSSAELRAQWLDEVRETVAMVFPDEQEEELVQHGY